MDKFRVISDLHLDINENFKLRVKDKNTFTLICGDTAGEIEMGYEWISKNVTSGLIVNGNHMPYNCYKKTMQELREEISKKYPITGPISYLDGQINCVKKEVDGIIFLGSCMYSDMRISDWRNPNGNPTVNKMRSYDCMNDFRMGIKERVYDFGPVNEPRYVKITPSDYEEWFNNAYAQIEKELVENEKLESPKPVVLFTHYPLIKKLLEESLYDSVADNFASYGSDMEKWILRHQSIKCYCCGHAHDIRPNYRNYKLERDDGTYCLVVNNARGYVKYGHDYNFNPNTFVNTKTWEIEKILETKDEIERKKKQQEKNLALASIFF